MSNIVVREVDFNGAALVAAHLEEEDKTYVGVRWVCEGIGLTIDQAKRQMKNIQTDLVVSQGVSNLTLPTNSGQQEVLCIELDFLPLWLAKISITPRMKKESPSVVNNLVEYQLKAKDVLAEAFIKKEEVPSEFQFLQGILDKMIKAELEQKEIKGKVNSIESELNKETVAEGYLTKANIARSLGIYSLSDKPHNQFIDAIASELCIHNNKIGYEDEYVKVVRQTARGGFVTGEAYYSPLAKDLIQEYIDDCYAPLVSKYRRGPHKGSFKDSSFVLNRKRYKFNQATSDRYSS